MELFHASRGVVEIAARPFLGLAAMPALDVGFACRPTIAAPIGLAKHLCQWMAGDVQVMVVSEEGISKCVVYFYADEQAAEEDAGSWKITSRIMFDVSDIDEASDLRELKRWGPAMPYNTIRAAAQRCKEAMLACKHRPFLPTEVSDVCTICCEEGVPTVTMSCCSKADSSNRICRSCQGRCKRCPFCRVTNSEGFATNFRKSVSAPDIASLAKDSSDFPGLASLSEDTSDFSALASLAQEAPRLALLKSASAFSLTRQRAQSTSSLSSLQEETDIWEIDVTP